MNENEKNRNYDPVSSVDGEYHFSMREDRLYEDADFSPSDDSASMPRYYVPAEKKPKQKRSSSDGSRSFLKIACLCLACVLLGGVSGGFVAWKLAGGSAEIDEDEPISISSSATNLGVSNSPTDIYTLACKQTVGITTEVVSQNIFGQTSSTAVSGSGFIVTSDGYIITNYHVVEYASQYNLSISVMFCDGSSYPAQIIGTEPDNDIAVLKIDADGLVPVTVGDSDGIQVGDEVYAVGNPLGELDFSMTSGMVSALNRSIISDSASPAISMFQFDAAINSGNSGGPVFSASGDVIGVVTAKYSSSGIEGIGFAIPINDVVTIANDLITKGYVTGKAYMGVSIDTNYSSIYASYFGFPEGAFVAGVESGSCAETAGIRYADIITDIGEHSVTSYIDFTSALRAYHAGDSVTVTVYRDGVFVDIPLTFDESRPATTTH